MRRQLFWAVVLVLTSFGFARAQGVQTGELTGMVRSSDGLALPGATVTLKSPALQGTRSAVSDANGVYIFKGLPPGSYTATFELAGMSTVESKTSVALGGTAKADATLQIATVQETVTVTADLPSVLTTTQGGANYTGQTIDALSTSRTLAGIAELAPGLTDNTPNAGQVTISGGFAYDNVFLVDGVDVNDNLFGSANALFIEDAVEETQVLTSGISAEYGRFSGGVINAVTKRGGNTFSGSFRTDVTNPKWTAQTPFEKDSKVPKPDSKFNKAYQATLGGPIVKDRLWFFAAGRRFNQALDRTFPDTSIKTITTDENDRGELKLTGTISPNHTVQASYIFNNRDQVQPSFSVLATSGLRSIDPATSDFRSLPNRLFVVNYNGILTSNLFFEAQYSEKKFTFEDSGGNDTNIVTGSPFLTLGVTTKAAGHYNAPYFDATDPEDRNNRQITGALSYFLSTKSFGRHDIKGGVENFRTTRTGGNSQSPTNFVFYADYAIGADGKPLFDGNNLIPVFVPGESLRINYLASRGDQINITTNSFFLNDKWHINDHWSASLGLRYERVRAEATGGNIVGVDTDTIVPRLALSYDVKGDGKWKLDATYAHYAGKYNESQIGNNTNVGNPSYLYQVYLGPEGQGRSFAPGFDSANWETFAGGFPTANIFFDESLSSPVTKEFTVAAGTDLGKGGYLKAIYTNRKVTNFIESFTTLDLGSTTVIRNGVDFGTFDNVLYKNTDVPQRKYQAVQLQARYRITDRWDVTGHYTHQLKNEGNFEGEARNQPAITTTFGDYPEIYVADRNFPLGRLDDFQKHKVRAWTTYNLGLGRAGDLDASLLWRYDSALTYSLTAARVPFSTIQKSRDPGYASPPASQTLFFGARGVESFAGVHLFDVALHYSIPVFKSVKPYVKFQVVNVLGNDKLTSWNTTISRRSGSPVDANGLATEYTKGALYGKGTGNSNYPSSSLIDGTTVNARAYSFSLGFRF